MSIANTQSYIDYINKLEEREENEDQKIQEEINKKTIKHTHRD